MNAKYSNTSCKKHEGHTVVLIAISLALSQTPV